MKEAFAKSRRGWTRRAWLLSSASLGLSAVAGCAGLTPTIPTRTPAPTAPTANPTPTEASLDLPVSPTTVATATPSPAPIPATATATAVPRTAIWWTGPSDAGWLGAANAAAERISVTMPGLTITASGGHEDFGKIVSGLASGQSPDLLDLGTLDAYAARGMLKKLSPYSDQTPTLQRNYLQPVWSNGTWNGDLYGIPALDHGPEVGLVWNESLAGDHLSASTPPASWDDLLTVGASLTTRDDSGGLKVLGFDPLDGVGGLLDTARDVTGLDWFDPSARKINLANGTYAAFLQSIATLYTTVGISQLAQFRQDVPPLTGDAGSGMCSGRQVAILTGYWSAAELKRLRRDSSWTFGATWLPPRPAGAKVQRIAGRTITIPTAAPHPNDAWAAIQVLVGDDTNADFLARTGRFAATKSFVGSAAVRQYPELRFFIESIDQATMLSARENNPVAGFAQSKWEQAIQAVLGGGTTAPDALAAAQKSTEIELARLAK